MTQFLLVSSARPYPEFPELVFSPPQQSSFLAEAAAALFSGRTTPAWSVAPVRSEAGDIAYAARDAVLAGRAIEYTVLGRLLRHAIGRGDGVALFYAADCTGLPQAQTPQDLFRLLDAQLRAADSGNLELYARWP